jgi:translation initiation factor 6 (eIF-6)
MEKYTYSGITYIPRTKSFKPYRVQALALIKKFNDFEKEFTSDLQTDINKFLFTDKRVMGSVITANNSGDSKKLNEAVSKALVSNPEMALKAKELTDSKILAVELFLTTDCKGNVSEENAVKLCDIMLEDSGTINHNPDTEAEYGKYLEFIYSVWRDFFLKFKK